MRLNKFIAQASGISRREADNAISGGRVEVNGYSPELGIQVEDGDIVKLDGIEIHLPANYKYLLVNKPVSHVTSRNSQDGSPTIYDLLPNKYSALKYVGRLDKESAGLVLMTDDGDYTHQLTHPSFRKEKVYEIELESKLSSENVERINKGVDLEDGVSNMTVSNFSGNQCTVSMSEGRNRQIRRTFGALGLTITKLLRTRFGEYSISDLEGNEFIEVKKR